MSKAPIGAVVSIGYDADPGASVTAGDVLRTPTGRMYRVLVARLTMRANRYALRAIVIDAMPEAGFQTHDLHWNPRPRRKR